MMEELETLLRINTVLSMVPILVGVGVTRILARQRQMREDLDEVRKEAAVLEARGEDAKERVVRLEDIVMKKEGGESR